MAERDLSKQPKPRTPRKPIAPGLAEEREANGEDVPMEYTRADRHVRANTGRSCKTCVDDDRAEIEKMIVAGKPWMTIARATGKRINYQAIRRHARECVPAILKERAKKMQEDDDLTADIVKEHLAICLERTDESHAAAMEMVDDNDQPREHATGIAAAARAHLEAAKTAGQAIGMFDQKNKVEILLRDPETQDVLIKLLDTLCPECVVAAKETLEALT